MDLSNKSNLFRSCSGKEEEAVSVMDYRDIFSPESRANNDVLIICDHASPDLKQIYNDQDSEKWCDVGAAELTAALAERLECMAICTNFSQLLIDPSQPIINNNLIRTYFDQDQINKEEKPE